LSPRSNTPPPMVQPRRIWGAAQLPPRSGTRLCERSPRSVVQEPVKVCHARLIPNPYVSGALGRSSNAWCLPRLGCWTPHCPPGSNRRHWLRNHIDHSSKTNAEPTIAGQRDSPAAVAPLTCYQGKSSAPSLARLHRPITPSSRGPVWAVRFSVSQETPLPARVRPIKTNRTGTCRPTRRLLLLLKFTDPND
jgi:hypothetical protein